MSWHSKQSAHNRDAYAYLSESARYADWEITTLFYSTLHMIDEHLFSKTGKTPGSHTGRNKQIKRELGHIHGDYYKFYALCKKVRYVVAFDGVTEKDRRDAVRLHDSIHARMRARPSATGVSTHPI